MKGGIRHAMRIARRYAEGGSDDDDTPINPPIMRPGASVIGHRPVLQVDPIDPTQSGHAAPGAGRIIHETAPEPVPSTAPPPEPMEPQRSAKQDQPTAVQHWSQAIADHLVSRHGDDYPAAEEAIRDIGTNYSQRAADAVWSKMPLEHQMGMMDSKMQEDLGPAAYRMATDPANWKVEADRKLATNYQEQPEAPQQSGPQLPAGYTVQPYPPHGFNVMHPSGGIYAQGPTPQQAAETAIRMGVARNEPDFNGFAYPPDAPFEERIPVRTAPAQGAAGVSRSGYASPYGIHSQQQEPPPADEEAYDYNLSQFEGEHPVGFDEVPLEQHPFSRMSRAVLDTYQKYLQPHFGDINEFAKKFFGGYDTRDIAVEGASHPGYGENSISFDGSLNDKGKHVADTSISINPDTNSAHLGLIQINPEYRGQTGGEAGKKLLRNQIDMYKQMGLDYVDLYAAGGGDPYGGSYAWAKYGFTPNKEDWDLMRQRFSQRLDRFDSFKPLDPEVETVVKNILSDPDPRAVWRLSDVTALNKNGVPVGKNMLLSHGWSGQLTFKDTPAMERFDAYLKRPKKQSLDRSPND